MEEITLSEEEKISRRKVIGGLGIGLASLATAQVFAAPGAQHKDVPAPPHSKTQLLNIQNHHLKVSRRSGLDLPVRWTLSQTMENKAIKAQDV